MPKLKTKKALAKRVKITKKKKLVRAKAGRRHLLAHKKSNRKRKLRKSVALPKGQKKALIKALPYG